MTRVVGFTDYIGPSGGSTAEGYHHLYANRTILASGQDLYIDLLPGVRPKVNTSGVAMLDEINGSGQYLLQEIASSPSGYVGDGAIDISARSGNITIDTSLDMFISAGDTMDVTATDNITVVSDQAVTASGNNVALYSYNSALDGITGNIYLFTNDSVSAGLSNYSSPYTPENIYAYSRTKTSMRNLGSGTPGYGIILRDNNIIMSTDHSLRPLVNGSGLVFYDEVMPKARFFANLDVAQPVAVGAAYASLTWAASLNDGFTFSDGDEKVYFKYPGRYFVNVYLTNDLNMGGATMFMQLRYCDGFTCSPVGIRQAPSIAALYNSIDVTYIANVESVAGTYVDVQARLTPNPEVPGEWLDGTKCGFSIIRV